MVEKKGVKDASFQPKSTTPASAERMTSESQFPCLGDDNGACRNQLLKLLLQACLVWKAIADSTQKPTYSSEA